MLKCRSGRQLAEPLTADGRLRVIESPWDAVPVAEALWWHLAHTHDPEHVWLRVLFTEAGAAMGIPT